MVCSRQHSARNTPESRMKLPLAAQLLCSALPLVRAGQSRQTSLRVDGAQIFRNYAACHGRNGKGNGPCRGCAEACTSRSHVDRRAQLRQVPAGAPEGDHRRPGTIPRCAWIARDAGLGAGVSRCGMGPGFRRGQARQRRPLHRIASAEMNAPARTRRRKHGYRILPQM